jgi:hypothetical protein
MTRLSKTQKSLIITACGASLTVSVSAAMLVLHNLIDLPSDWKSTWTETVCASVISSLIGYLGGCVQGNDIINQYERLTGY